MCVQSHYCIINAVQLPTVIQEPEYILCHFIPHRLAFSYYFAKTIKKFFIQAIRLRQYGADYDKGKIDYIEIA